MKFNSLPNYKIWVITTTLMLVSLLDRVENILGKRENASYQHFLFFPRCFQNLSVEGSLKLRTVLHRVHSVIV